jgi:AraC-like DNA-binding protein
MRFQEATSGGAGLERSCERGAAGFIVSTQPVEGVELFRAGFTDEAYARHRHDTYAVGVTDRGVQLFGYRGAVRVSTPGRVVVLYPDEVHDGRAGTHEGFSYRIVYVEPARLADALRVVRGRPGPLPYVSEPVSTDPRLARAVDRAFGAPLESLVADGIVVELAESLLAAAGTGDGPGGSPHVDAAALARARGFLDAERTRVVHSTELESITGLTRYDLARQFRIAYGTSPYRYLIMRRLDLARTWIHQQRPLVSIACDAGFADQAHFTRTFKAAFGLTPARYRALRAGSASSRSRRADPRAT